MQSDQHKIKIKYTRTTTTIPSQPYKQNKLTKQNKTFVFYVDVPDCSTFPLNNKNKTNFQKAHNKGKQTTTKTTYKLITKQNVRVLH